MDEDDDGLGSTVVTLGASDAAPRFLSLVVIGDGSLTTHALLPGRQSMTIGRSPRCDVVINHSSLSRKHAVIVVGDTPTIEDLGSANGTKVRGKKLAPGQPAAIAIGEVVRIGPVSIMLQQQSSPVRPRRILTHDFAARVDEECARAERGGPAFALLAIHPEAEIATDALEEHLCALVRGSDVLGKAGPHDYEVLLPDTTSVQAEEAVRRLGARLRERGVRCRVAYACCPRDGRTARELVASMHAPARAKARTARTDIVVEDAQMHAIHRLVSQIAGAPISVLLLGETGVGKEVFARSIHAASPRAAGPFVEINCAALTETLLETELFGHEKGAFTHATTARPGLVESAHGGTLFLDEIGDMALTTQAKLLRVIEDSQVRRVGSLKAKSIDVRFVAATNADLEAKIARGQFRSDLFFRLNGITIVIPPLRDRTAELAALARVFLERAWKQPGPPPELAAETLALMKRYAWPGNVRELKHMMERAILLAGAGPILPDHLPREKLAAPREEPAAAAPTLPASRPMLRKGSPEEQKWILDALERAGGNQTAAASLLGISRRTLINRLDSYGNVFRPRKEK